MSAYQIKTIAATQTYPLRQQVLRPQQTLADMEFPGDFGSDTLHRGAFLQGRLVGIASLYREAHALFPGEDVWRLRGMAVDPNLQQRSCGRLLLEAVIVDAVAAGAELIWCNARTPAVGFYLRLGFATAGEEFEIAGVGPHFVMAKRI